MWIHAAWHRLVLAPLSEELQEISGYLSREDAKRIYDASQRHEEM